MQCLRRRIDFRRCLAFLLPPLLLMLYQLLFSEYTSLYPDARLYLSIADNFLHTGHFIQTDRVGVEIVVPFAYPLYITLLRAVGMPLVGFTVLNLLSVGASSVFLYDTERRLFGSGGFSCMAYTVILLRVVLPPSNLYVEFFYLFMLCWLQWLAFREGLPPKKRLLLMNIAAFLAFASRPVLAPIYAAVVLYTLWKCVKERLSRTLPVAVVIVPLLIFAFNTAVNYRETGEIIPISNYAADAVCFALNPNSTIWTSQLNFTADDTVPELLEIYGNGALSLSEKNRAFYALTRQFVLHNTGHVVSVTLKRAWTMFFYFTHGMMTASLLGALWMLRRTPRGETRSLVLAELVLSALLVVITSAGIYEARYILPVWPAAAIHIAAIPHYVLRWYFARRHAKQK